eukprot:1151411-Pelagomonas_calceolata.AAC.4
MRRSASSPSWYDQPPFKNLGIGGTTSEVQEIPNAWGWQHSVEFDRIPFASVSSDNCACLLSVEGKVCTFRRASVRPFQGGQVKRRLFQRSPTPIAGLGNRRLLLGKDTAAVIPQTKRLDV